MTLLQYFVFDETGDNLLEANCIRCETEQEVRDISNEIIELAKNENLGLVLNDNTNGKVLYNSREE